MSPVRDEMSIDSDPNDAPSSVGAKPPPPDVSISDTFRSYGAIDYSVACGYKHLAPAELDLEPRRNKLE